jgi:hypothetical protein
LEPYLLLSSDILCVDDISTLRTDRADRNRQVL